MTDLSLEREMRLVLANLELIPHGHTQTIDANRVHGSKDRSEILRADPEGYPHEIFRERWNAAGTDAARALVLREAQAALGKLRRSAAPKESHLLEKLSLPWRRAVANDDRPIAAVAREFNTSRQTVRDCIERYREVDEEAA